MKDDMPTRRAHIGVNFHSDSLKAADGSVIVKLWITHTTLRKSG